MTAQDGSRALSRMADDVLGAVAVSVVIGEVTWSPDVAPLVVERVARDAVAYPEHLDRRPRPGPGWGHTATGARSPRRALGRGLVIGLVLAAVGAVVLAVATADVSIGAAVTAAEDAAAVSFGTDAAGEIYAVDQGGRILRVVREDP